jgi:hypothetical protein
MKRGIIGGIAAATFMVGIVIGYFAVPLIIHEKTIQQKLRDLDIEYRSGYWGVDFIKSGEDVFQASDFREFVGFYDYVREYLDNDVKVWIDSSYNVVWVDYREDTNIKYLGFYFY